ncbi:MAG: type II toxin-antitoxin system RelE/ParE family toxin [Candidatus Omnitrophica bacterium]|nr:type II toxin-antitoxin system RelE/ParE family toxin [Candidatus Omnitrophota bacterium]
MSLRPFDIRVTRRAEKDIDRLTPKLRRRLYEVLTEALARDPYQGKKLIGDLAGSYSYRLTLHDRIVYSIDATARTIYIERAATHYGK